MESNKIHQGQLMKFVYNEMPTLKPIVIPTSGIGFFETLSLWWNVRRKWKLTVNWEFCIDGVWYYIPEGFEFDGASVPKFLWYIASSTGILLIPSLVHDWLYYNEALLIKFSGKLSDKMNRDECDLLFCNIAISVNGIKIVNYMAYYGLYFFGWIAWNKHRKLGNGE